MKILTICGSPRGKKSQTNVLAARASESAKAQGAEVEIVDLCKARIGFCQACDQCHAGPDCVFHDDARAILDKVLAADGLVLASPVYLNQVTAQMKALLDRTSHFIHCLRLTGKYLAVVTTSGGGGGGDLQQWLKNYGHTVGMQCVGGVDARVPLQEANLTAATELGAALVAAIRAQTVYPEQTRIIEDRKRNFARIIEQRKDHWPFEYKLWQEMGWL